MVGQSGVILCLDIASVVGWAHAARAAPPSYGSQRMGARGCDPEDCGIALERWLREKLDEVDPEFFIFEAPLAGFGRGGAEVPYRLTGMAYLAAVTAKKRGVKIFKVEVSTTCKFFTGKGRWPSSKDKKNAVIQKCREYGWSPADDNAGDALAILSYAQSIIHKGAVERVAGPLFTAF